MEVGVSKNGARGAVLTDKSVGEAEVAEEKEDVENEASKTERGDDEPGADDLDDAQRAGHAAAVVAVELNSRTTARRSLVAVVESALALG